MRGVSPVCVYRAWTPSLADRRMPFRFFYVYWVSRNFVGIIFYTRKVLLTSHYEKRLFEYASQPRVAGSDIRLLSYLWS